MLPNFFHTQHLTITQELTVNSTITAKPFYRKNGFIQLIDGKVKKQDLMLKVI